MVLKWRARESTRREPALGRFLLRTHATGIGPATSQPSPAAITLLQPPGLGFRVLQEERFGVSGFENNC
jgi:hypothetical protein